ncbi:glycoside hydrolase family 97 protein [Duganella sp. BJB488]|uniref:glycoside hydrolase family 97 protein n=1 Tax=unclassified Duganella TaxID=2636909 RepID=UPI000E340656|nr:MULTISPECIES: glycoside hydrolase family 97 protein [unclassified Duganella]RFP09386.1 glycoside hydrolase family 97 protein [Duganella sp. BJB489]RFP13091.1 glycoside hydrolase family 97 protein [Duganella sp. BJB488]RFP29180.1 glycoside hydrolase family 97 protein [Duganella sp. BJB480]
MMKTCFTVVALAASAMATASQPALTSPDRHISVSVLPTSGGGLAYSISRDGKPVLLASDLGLQLQGADLASALTLAAASKPRVVSDQYEMAVGKKRSISYRANEQTFTVRNAQRQAMDIVFRVSNDGVAFRYVVAEPTLPHKKLIQERTTFALPPAAKAWMQPIAVAQTGWGRTNPSYEEHYQMDVPVGTVSPSPAGWVFPALFKSGDNWVAISEAGMDGSFQASRLAPESAGGKYSIGNPMAAEVYPERGLMAEVDGTLTSPWRLLALGSLQTVTNSTLGTDLAAPAIAFDKQLVKPGHASWSWALMKDDATVYDVQKKFIDYAADMHWDYTLIDADWDRKIGYDKVKELVDYAATKKVGILLWYNSSGPWNSTVYSPKSQLLTHEQRVAEFKRLHDMGVKGVKIDFFNGDAQSMIAYYVSILRDAADAGLLVNFHGATLPRGWTRTWPNLMTMEAVRGMEFTTFEQADEDKMPTHAAMLPFARNLFDPMDFTPMVFGDIPKIKRTSSNGFELATSVLYISGIQHFAEIPEGMATVPAYVKSFLQELPRSWDDSRLVDGYPGQYAVIARRSGDTWYIAGINATESDKTLTLDLSFAGAKQGVVIGDGDAERSFNQRGIDAGKKVAVTIKPHGGFVIKL